MARSTDLKDLVEQFAAALEGVVARRANEAFAAKFDAVKSQILGGGTAAPRAAAPAAAPAGRVTRKAAGRASYAAALKPCPVCGTPNKARRFSYLCDSHRSPENLSKFKGAAKAGAAKAAAPVAKPAKRGPGRPPKAVGAKRGPGRPPKSATAPAPAKAE